MMTRHTDPNNSSPIKLAINGYGRIGRCFVRALMEAPDRKDFQITGINEPADLQSMAYLTQYDSTHGRLDNVSLNEAGHALEIGGLCIPVSHATQPESVPWKEWETEIVVECSGQYSKRSDLERFLNAGCPRLLLSHPGHSSDDVDATIVYGITEDSLLPSHQLVSAASCTTNAAVPVLSLLHELFGIDQVLLTTIHSVMNDQPLIDGYHHTDLRRTRSAMQSIIPVATGLARGVERLMPALTGKVQAKAIRVPTLNVSAIDITLQLQSDTTVDAINAALRAASKEHLNYLIDYTEQAHASVDFNHSPFSAIIDGSQTRVNGKRQVNLFIWFDNEWGFVNRMLDVLRHWIRTSRQPA